MQLTLEDKWEIEQLIARYGHLIDGCEFSRLDEIFTGDALFDLSGYGGDCYRGLSAIVEMMASSEEHPLAHHASNIVFEEVLDGPDGVVVTLLSKGLGVGHRGRVGSVTYRDHLRREAGQWRISARYCELRRSDR